MNKMRLLMAYMRVLCFYFSCGKIAPIIRKFGFYSRPFIYSAFLLFFSLTHTTTPFAQLQTGAVTVSQDKSLDLEAAQRRNETLGRLVSRPNMASQTLNMINSWLRCLECNNNELNTVAKLGTEAVPYLSSVLQSGDYSDLYRSRAAIALAKIGGDVPKQALESTLEMRMDQALRAFIEQALKRLENEIVIVIVGESVASGQGNPDQPMRGTFPNTAPAEWLDHDCYRSGQSGHAMVAQEIEDRDPGTQVRLINLACSGATMPRIIDQLDEAERLTAGKEIDILLVSAGGNDIGFGQIVTACAALERCFVRDTSNAYPPELNDVIRFVKNVQQRIDALPPLFVNLANKINQLTPKAVYITEYFDPTHALPQEAMASRHMSPFEEESAIADAYCHQLRQARSLAQTAVDQAMDSMIWSIMAQETIGLVDFLNWVGIGPVDFDGITPEESKWAFEKVVLPLNRAVARAASEHGWNYVGGIMSSFYYHGSCASDHWIVRGNESLRIQGDLQGTMHPNNKGHDQYKKRILTFILDGGQTFTVEPIWDASGSIYVSQKEGESYSGSCVYGINNPNIAIACVPEVYLKVVMKDPNGIGRSSIVIDGITPDYRKFYDSYSQRGGITDLGGDIDCTSVEQVQQISIEDRTIEAEEHRRPGQPRIERKAPEIVVGVENAKNGVVCNVTRDNLSRITWFIKITANGIHNFDFHTIDNYGLSRSTNSLEVSVDLQDQQVIIPQHHVTEVVMNTDTTEYYADICPKRLTFSGTISVDNPGLVSYRFVRSDGASESIRTLMFEEPGSKSVNTVWSVGNSIYANIQTFDGWVRLEVLEPQRQQSNNAEFILTCGQRPYVDNSEHCGPGEHCL